MTPSNEEIFKQDYQRHLQHLTLKGYRPKTIEGYARGVRRVAAYFDHDINDLTNQQMADYFSDLLSTHSWSAVKHDLYGIKFFYRYALNKPWQHNDLVKPPSSKRIPDIVTTDEAMQMFATTDKVSYRVFFFTLYSLGLRLGEGLRLEVGDIDGERHRVHIRDSKGNKDRFVPLPDNTYLLLRRFWSLHKHPRFIFPNRKGGLNSSRTATTHMNQGGVQSAMQRVVADCGLKKRYLAIA